MEQQFNPADKITVDVPLFIRLLEYAREDAKTDMDLHKVTENAVVLSETGKTLTMADYDSLVAGNSEDQEMNEIKRMIKLANIKTFFQ
jgi:TfoX/Sxy family transcriptional regulator of competence genes